VVEASGKKGCPALIIESILPEIEEEANVLLSRISDGRMRVRFSTQKEKKSATKKEIEAGENSVSETLDIFVEDDEGERELEMFSGGERFRANFSIRIALARLLARRSGVQNRVLLIDEGGSELDGDGKQAFVSAIREISRDFEKVLIISHIEDIIEAFETRIEVVKEGGVSVLK
jgi:exonuclease SbcC